MKVSLKELKASINYLEKNSDMDSIRVSTSGHELTLTAMDIQGSEIQITLFQIGNNGDSSMMARVRRTELLPLK